MTEVCCRSERSDHALVRRVLITVLHLRCARVLGRRHQQVADVDDALELADPIEEIQHRVVRTVEFHVEGNFGVVLLRVDLLGGITAQFHACLLRFAVEDGDEAVNLFLVRNDASFDLKLLLEFGQLLLDLLQLRTIGFEFVIFPDLIFQGMLRSRVLFDPGS